MRLTERSRGWAMILLIMCLSVIPVHATAFMTGKVSDVYTGKPLKGVLVISNDELTITSLKAIIDLAKAMNKQTIAKFVEKADDLGILWNLGFDYVQGNYFQQADSQLDYAFADETTLSSDTASPTWATSRR